MSPRRSAWRVILAILTLSIQATLLRAQRATITGACWSSVAPPATPHQYHAVVALDGKIYAVGGGLGGAFEVYDPQRDVWTTLAQMPEPRLFAAAAASAGKIYVLGGTANRRVSVARVDEYDVALQTWTRRADMPTARDRLAAVFVDGKLLAIGGLASESRNLDVVEVYDPALDRWSPGPALPVARHAHSAVEVNGRVFVFGGYGTSGGVLVSPLSRTDVLDRQASAWMPRADLPTARGFLGAAVLGPFIFAMGGRTQDGAPIERYDVATDAWEVVGEMPIPRQRFGAAAANGRIVVVGGEESPRTAAVYDPRCSTTRGTSK